MNTDAKDPHRYDDILLLPHHVSKKHPRMPAQERAAQFLSYRALSGFEDRIREAELINQKQHDDARGADAEGSEHDSGD